MTSKDNIIYYTITAVVFVGIVVCSLLFHNPGQPANDDSERRSMTEIISTIVIAAATVVTATATVILAKITSRYAETTDKILKASNKPEILVSLVPHEIYTNTIYLCIQNVGTGFATDIKLTSVPSFAPLLPGNRSLEEFGIFKQGIDYLGPGNKVQIFLFWTHHLPTLPTQSLTITVNYKDCEPKNGIEFLLDFTMWEGVGQQFTQLEPIAEIEKVLKEDIAEALKGIERKL